MYSAPIVRFLTNFGALGRTKRGLPVNLSKIVIIIIRPYSLIVLANRKIKKLRPSGLNGGNTVL